MVSPEWQVSQDSASLYLVVWIGGLVAERLPFTLYQRQGFKSPNHKPPTEGCLKRLPTKCPGKRRSSGDIPQQHAVLLVLAEPNPAGTLVGPYLRAAPDPGAWAETPKLSVGGTKKGLTRAAPGASRYKDPN